MGIMAKRESWSLTGENSVCKQGDWQISQADVGGDAKQPWSVRARRLDGGLSDGVQLIDVDAGDLKFSACPTRGMGIWSASYKGWDIGWKSPVRGPVHPKFVNLLDLGGIGWLAGFDEWIVRCGLASNGAPGLDVLQDNFGNKREMMLPLHGRIANLPASDVSVTVHKEPPYFIEIRGVVDESTLFMPQLRLTTTISIEPGSGRMTIHDQVINLKSQPEEVELLYHCNFGPPLLEEGSEFLAPATEIAPRDATAEQAIDSYSRYPGPTPGVIEQVYFYKLRADRDGRSLAVLQNASKDKACALRVSTKELPCFTLWKNPGAESDGYVTGLEPGTNYPNHKSFERKQGRVMVLPPGGVHEVHLEIQLADGKADVSKLAAEVQALQGQMPPVVHATAQPGWSV